MTEDSRSPQRGFNLAGPRLRDLRRARRPRMSQQALADALQRKGIVVDISALSRMEAGARGINDWELKALFEVLEVTWSQVFES